MLSSFVNYAFKLLYFFKRKIKNKFWGFERQRVFRFSQSLYPTDYVTMFIVYCPFQ